MIYFDFLYGCSSYFSLVVLVVGKALCEIYGCSG